MGVTLYAFVYGKLPFHDDNIVVLYDKIRNAALTFTDIPFVSDDLKDLITLMLEKNPANRITLPDIKVCGVSVNQTQTQPENTVMVLAASVSDFESDSIVSRI